MIVVSDWIIAILHIICHYLNTLTQDLGCLLLCLDWCEEESIFSINTVIWQYLRHQRSFEYLQCLVKISLCLLCSALFSTVFTHSCWYSCSQHYHIIILPIQFLRQISNFLICLFIVWFSLNNLEYFEVIRVACYVLLKNINWRVYFIFSCQFFHFLVSKLSLKEPIPIFAFG